MAERDRFELDLGTALRAYAEDAPTQARPTELARHFAAAYPHRRAVIGPWRLVATPRLAWTLVLLAALLSATVVGTLVVGSQVQRLLTAVPVFVCPPGSTPDVPGPADQARPPQDALTAMVFDRRAGKLVAITEAEVGVETWTFDVCTNTWTPMHPNRELAILGGGLVYDVDSDLTIAVDSLTGVWAYDLRANTWSLKGSVPPIDATSLVYDPATGLVVASTAGDARTTRRTELSSYDVATDTWTPIRQANPGPAGEYGVTFAYDAKVDRMIAYSVRESGNETWLLDLRSGAWSRAGADTPTIHGLWGMGTVVPAIAYDEAAQRTVVLGMGGLAAYDATADRWEILVGSADPEQGWLRFGPSSQWRLDTYDPVNERLVGRGDGNSMWGFDPATRRWTVLVEGEAGTELTEFGFGPFVPAQPGSVADLEAMLPSEVNGVTFTKTSVAGGVPSTRLGKGGWGRVPIGADGLKPVLDFYDATLADLDVAIATPTDASKADTFVIAFRVKGHDPTEFSRLFTDYSGLGPTSAATVGGRQVQALREAGGMGFDVYVEGDVVFYVFTDGSPLIDAIVAALP